MDSQTLTGQAYYRVSVGHDPEQMTSIFYGNTAAAWNTATDIYNAFSTIGFCAVEESTIWNARMIRDEEIVYIRVEEDT